MNKITEFEVEFEHYRVWQFPSPSKSNDTSEYMSKMMTAMSIKSINEPNSFD